MTEEEGPAISVRSLLLTIGLGVGSALLLHLPLIGVFGTHLPALGFGDPYIQAWQIAWGGHALLHQPFDFFQANLFWPAPDSLAFSDALIGYAPVGMLGRGISSAVVRYNSMFIFSYALAFVAPALLARQLGFRWFACWVAGAAFAYAPFRLDQNTHLHVISSGGIALALFLLLRGFHRESKAMLIAGWLVAAWQVSLGFTLGLPFAYLLGACLGIAVYLGVRRGWPERQVMVGTALGLALFVSWMVIHALPYLSVSDAHPQAVKSQAEVAFYSPPLSGLLAAPESSFLWSTPTAEYRGRLSWPSEQALFPGASVTVLAAAGLWLGRLSARAKMALGTISVLAAMLALGSNGPFGGRFYWLAYDWLPGWRAMRVPGRLMVFSMLSLSLLAAAGVDKILEVARTFPKERAAHATIATLLVLAVVLEGAGKVSVTKVPDYPGGFENTRAPQLHLPSDEFSDRLFTFWSVEGFPEIANGLASFTPEMLERIRGRAEDFPDQGSVAFLHSLGIETVVVHTDLMDQTQTTRFATAYEDFSGEVIRRGSVLVFSL